MRASVPSGRAVASASCAEPYRPMPLPALNLASSSSFLFTKGNRALAPAPPPVRESLNAPSALGLGLGFVGSAAQLIVTTAAGGVGLLAFVPTTAQVYTRLRNSLTRPNSS